MGRLVRKRGQRAGKAAGRDTDGRGGGCRGRTRALRLPAPSVLNSRKVQRISRQSISDRYSQMAKTNPVQFIQQARGEIAKVAWPSRREVMLTTIMVFIMAALTSTFFSLVDMAIRFGLKLVIGTN